MASNAPDPPGAQPVPNPPDDLFSLSKTPKSQEVRPAVTTAFTQDFPTQSTVKYTQTDGSQKFFPPPREPTITPTTAAAMVATPSYAPTEAPTQPVMELETKASKLDDFINFIRYKPLPPDIATEEISANTGEIQELQYVTNCLKQEINDAYMGYSFYYTTNDIRVHPDKNVDLLEADINAAHKILAVTLDAGFGAPRTTMPYKILTSTSWFRLAFSLLGAMLRGAIRSDQFRKYGRDSLNGTADHAIIQEGLPRPLRFGQLLSAMANQLATMSDPDSHYPGDHHTKMYEKATEIVSDKVQAALLAKAWKAVTAEDEAAAQNVVWIELVCNTKEELQSNLDQRARVEAEVANIIVTSLHAKDQQTIDEWRAAWTEGLRAAIREEPFQPRATTPPQSQLLRDNEVEARVAIAARLQEVKEEFLQDLKRQIASEQDERIQAEANQKYEELVAERILTLERDLEAQHSQRVNEAKARAESDIRKEVEPWKTFEVERLKGLFSATTSHKVLNNDTALLKAAADKLGYDVVERAQPTKKQRTAPDAGHKRSRSGSRARRTPSPGARTQDDMDVTPTKADKVERGRQLTLPRLELTYSSKVAELQQVADKVQQTKLAADQTVKASMHNPANQMTDDLEMQAHARGEAPGPSSEEAVRTIPIPPKNKEDPVLKAVLAGIQNLTIQFNSVTTRLTTLEQAQKPSDPRLRGAQTQGAQTMAESRPPPTTTPPKAPPKAQTPPTRPDPTPQAPQALQESSWPTLGGARTSGRPQQPTVATKQPWVKVARASTIKAHEAAQNLSRSAAAAQDRTPSGRRKAGRGPPPPANSLTTRITIARNGGLTDQNAENALRNTRPEHIVMAARTAAENLSAETIQILGGHWAGSAAKTGNFVFTINGKIPYEEILPFEAAFVNPLKVGEMMPLDGWLWTQLREVPTTGPDGVVYDNDTLTAELRRNPAFHGVTLCTLAHWQKSVEKVMHDAEATLQVSYLDETGEVTKSIQRSDIHMFGRKVKFFVIGNNPRLAQCSRCHDIGHEARSPLCKLPGNALKCHLCGGSHHSVQHDFFCKGTHKLAGICDCKRKCILCKGSGHHAHSRNCPKRGNFAPPPLSKFKGVRTPAPPPTTTQNSGTTQEAEPTNEALVTTQREPSVQEDLPAPRKAKKKRTGKGGKGHKNQNPRADKPLSILDTLTPPPARVDDAMEPLDFTEGWGTETFASAKGWDNPGEDDDDISDFDPSQDGSSTQLHTAPALQIVEDAMLLSKEALWEHYKRKGPDETPMCHWHEEIELGWGGLRRDSDGGMNTKEALGLRARYAAQYMLPTTGPEVVASLCKGLHPSNQSAHLEKTDKEWGGNGSGAHLTALNYFTRNVPHNLLLVHHTLPLTAEKAMEGLKSVNDYDLRLMTEEYDLQMGGTGSGTYFFHAIPHCVLDANPDIQARIMTMQTPPSLRQPLGKAAAAVAEHARQLTANGT